MTQRLFFRIDLRFYSPVMQLVSVLFDLLYGASGNIRSCFRCLNAPIDRFNANIVVFICFCNLPVQLLGYDRRFQLPGLFLFNGFLSMPERLLVVLCAFEFSLCPGIAIFSRKAFCFLRTDLWRFRFLHVIAEIHLFRH